MPPRKKRSVDAVEKGEETEAIILKKTKSKEDSETPSVTSNDKCVPYGTMEPGQMKIVSFNVNGWASVNKKGFKEYVEKEDPDILCLQEIKIASEKVPDNFLKGYTQVFHSCKKPQHHGTAVFVREKHIKITKGLQEDYIDDEGRAIVIELDKYYLINTYVPNSSRGLVNMDKRLAWNKKFMAHVLELQKKKPIIWCGDLNVAHHEIDLKNPKSNKKTAGFTQEERDGFTEFLGLGFVDTYRHFHPGETDCYTYWSMMSQARSRDVGWRLDYFVVSEGILEKVKYSFRRKEVLGSEYVPHLIPTWRY